MKLNYSSRFKKRVNKKGEYLSSGSRNINFSGFSSFGNLINEISKLLKNINSFLPWPSHILPFGFSELFVHASRSDYRRVCAPPFFGKEWCL